MFIDYKGAETAAKEAVDALTAVTAQLEAARKELAEAGTVGGSRGGARVVHTLATESLGGADMTRFRAAGSVVKIA
jgi:hypothetical protein